MLKSLRVSYWLIAAFWRKHLSLILLALPLGFIAFLAWTRLAPLLPQPQSPRRIGRVGKFTLRTLPPDILNRLSQGLTALTPDHQATPSLALKWDQSADGTSYIFYLDPKAAWSNGQPVTASQLTYSIANVAVTYPEPATIQFDLQEPYAPFPLVVSQPIFYTPARARLALTIGPYRIRELKLLNQFIAKLSLESAADTYRYTFYPTQEAALTGFKLGEVDRLEDINEPKDLSHWPNVTLTPQLRFDRYTAVFFNTKDPQLQDKTLRQALTYAIPQKPENDTRSLSSFSPQSWAYNPQVKPYLTNLETARDLLQKSQEEAQVKTLPSIELSTALIYLPLAEAIKANWDSLGVATTVKVITHVPDQFQALLVTHQIPPDPDQYTLWHSSQPSNITGYNSPKADKLLEDGRRELDPAKRKAIYQDFQRFLIEDTPAAFLFYPTTYTISRK
jgi:peptide/nickel transport system substrate-binding protein